MNCKTWIDSIEKYSFSKHTFSMGEIDAMRHFLLQVTQVLHQANAHPSSVTCEWTIEVLDFIQNLASHSDRKYSIVFTDFSKELMQLSSAFSQFSHSHVESNEGSQWDLSFLALRLDSCLLSVSCNLDLKAMAQRWHHAMIQADVQGKESIIQELIQSMVMNKSSSNDKKNETMNSQSLLGCKRRATLLKLITNQSVKSMLRLESILSVILRFITIEGVKTRPKNMIMIIQAFLLGFKEEQKETRLDCERKIFWRSTMALLINNNDLGKPKEGNSSSLFFYV